MCWGCKLTYHIHQRNSIRTSACICTHEINKNSCDVKWHHNIEWLCLHQVEGGFPQNPKQKPTQYRHQCKLTFFYHIYTPALWHIYVCSLALYMHACLWCRVMSYNNNWLWLHQTIYDTQKKRHHDLTVWAYPCIQNNTHIIFKLINLYYTDKYTVQCSM